MRDTFMDLNDAIEGKPAISEPESVTVSIPGLDADVDQEDEHDEEDAEEDEDEEDGDDQDEDE